MGQAFSSESQLQQPLHTAQATRADLEGQAHATMQWESQMKAKQQDILQELENLLKRQAEVFSHPCEHCAVCLSGCH